MELCNATKHGFALDLRTRRTDWKFSISRFIADRLIILNVLVPWWQQGHCGVMNAETEFLAIKICMSCAGVIRDIEQRGGVWGNASWNWAGRGGADSRAVLDKGKVRNAWVTGGKRLGQLCLVFRLEESVQISGSPPVAFTVARLQKASWLNHDFHVRECHPSRNYALNVSNLWGFVTIEECFVVLRACQKVKTISMLHRTTLFIVHLVTYQRSAEVQCRVFLFPVYRFQANLIRTMMQIEETFFELASSCAQNCLVICDRGVMDASSCKYMYCSARFTNEKRSMWHFACSFKWALSNSAKPCFWKK